MNARVSFAIACCIVVLAANVSSAQTYGPELGRLYLSFSNSSEVTEFTAISGTTFDIYLMADIDFTDIGEPSSRNFTDGVAGWETEIGWTPEPNPSDFLFVNTAENRSGAIPVDFTTEGSGTNPKLERIAAGSCLSISSGTVQLAHYQFLYVELTGMQAKDIVFSLAALAGGSFTAAPSGNAPGWIECLPFSSDVRYPFADYSSEITLNPSVVDLSVENVVAPGTLADACGAFQLDFDVTSAGLDPGPFDVSIWLSQDATLDGVDILLETYAITDMGTATLRAESRVVSPPAHLLNGNVFVLVEVDSGDVVAEDDENNNLAFDAMQIVGPALSVADVPNDQGLQVRLSWNASPYDAPAAPQALVQYEVYRRIPGTSAKPGQLLAKDRYSASKAILANFDYLGAVPIHGEFSYNMVVPTLEDGVATGFVVRAASTDPFVFYDSCEVDGTSVDDIFPKAPPSLTANYNGITGNLLMWDPSNDEDVVAFRVYRDTNPGFTPAPQFLIAELMAAEYTDAGAPNPFDQHYQVTAIDDAGNEGPPAIAVRTSTPGLGTVYALLGNKPNPFNPATTIEFRVPSGGGPVALRIFDTAGRLVRTVVEEFFEGGTHRRDWNGRDDTGTVVGSGTYFYRLEAPGFEETKKMLLLK